MRVLAQDRETLRVALGQLVVIDQVLADAMQAASRDLVEAGAAEREPLHAIGGGLEVDHEHVAGDLDLGRRASLGAALAHRPGRVAGPAPALAARAGGGLGPGAHRDRQ